MKTINATTTNTDLEDIIGEAIARSCKYNEIVRVIVADRAVAADAVNACSESSDSTETEDMSTGKCMTDIWGDDGHGGEFRLYLVAP